MIGQVLNGNYRLTDLVGTGGYADVYLARDLRSNTIVAVKILHTHVARDPDVAARFEREAALARRLQTPHVARILDAGQDPTSPPFMVMEFVQGLTVAELIRRHGPFPIPDALRIVDQLLIALGSAHALGIVHRDVKPQNLMIDAERRLKVLDFGVARIVGAGSLTASGHLLGTPEYMASEQVEGGVVDFRADLYGAGAVLYQLLSGRAPFLRYQDTDLWALIRQVRTELPPPIRQLRPELSPALAAVVERAMAKDPNQRYGSAFEMRQALAAAGGLDEPTPLPPPVAAPSSPGETQILGGPPPDLLTPRPVPPSERETRELPAIPPETRPYLPGQAPTGQTPPGPPGQRGAGQSPPGPVPPGPYPPGPYPPAQGPYPQPPRPGPPQGQVPPPPYGGPGQGYGPRPGQGYGHGQGQGAQRSGMPVWQIAALGAGAVVLVIVGVVLGRIVPLPGSSTPTPTSVAAGTPTLAATGTPGAIGQGASPVPTPGGGSPVVSGGSPVAVGSPQIAAPSPSPSPAVAVKPTSPPPSPTAAPKPTNAPGVILADNFDRPEFGQLLRTSPRPNDYTFSYDGGEYVINKTNPTLPSAPIVFLPGSYDNTIIAVDIRLMGDVTSRYAFVVCRDQSTGGQARQYRASMVPDERRLILSRWDDGNQRVLATVSDEPAINPGNARNRLELRCAGARIAASVNGKVVASADDMTLNRGDQGIGAGTFSGVVGTLEARFDNLEVRQP